MEISFLPKKYQNFPYIMYYCGTFMYVCIFSVDYKAVEVKWSSRSDYPSGHDSSSIIPLEI